MNREFLSSADQLAESDWAALDREDDPFISRAFLGAAERHGAAGPELGWQACHLVLRDGSGQVAAMVPLYRREHSFGDFSRDWDWPAAWRQAGLPYYPKLTTGVPFTPSPGPRLLVRQGADRAQWVRDLIQAAISAVDERAASTWHCLFVRESEATALQDAGLIVRQGVQFHWRNRGYHDFDDFLAGFSADKRKKIRRERRGITESGLLVKTWHGDEIGPELWQAIHRHYRHTFFRYGNHPAFSAEFFAEIGAQLGNRVVAFVAHDGDRAVASSLCFRNRRSLFGRHWGSDIELPGLHFELCYYQGLAYCIAHGLDTFEPGAQGEHKLARGFEPVPTWSAVWVANPRLREAVADFARRESRAMDAYAADAATHLPFKHGGDQAD